MICSLTCVRCVSPSGSLKVRTHAHEQITVVRATVAAAMQKAPTLRPPNQAARPSSSVKVRPRAKKAAALQKQVAAMMKAAAVHYESSSSSD
jgi:hypothetical protein